MLSFPSSGSAFLLASIAKFRMALMTCLEVNRVCRLHVSETVSHMACMESAAKVQLAVEDEMALQGGHIILEAKWQLTGSGLPSGQRCSWQSLRSLFHISIIL